MYSAKDFPPETLALLVSASAAINASQDLDETLSAIARSATEVMKAEASSVIMLDKTRGKQVFRAAWGPSAARVKDVEFDADIGISGEALERGQAILINDVKRHEGHYKELDARIGFDTRSVIACPLINNGERLGVVEVLNPVKRDAFSEKDRQLAQILANLAAIAVANSQLCERLRRDNRGLKHAVLGPVEMIGESPPICDVKDMIRRVARTASTVLLLGETGTGKELAARMVHQYSDRDERPFIAVNCAALPKTLLESELFGHEAGAFTGATERKLGRFELADGGSIFLDEIGEIDLDVQSKLLRVLEQKEIVRVGGGVPIGCDVRVIAATNRSLIEATKTGGFREDLYYRLNVFPIEIPPLRRRKEDIPLLVDHLIRRLAAELKVPLPTVTPEAMESLMAYDYPGNIRELQNILERASLLSFTPDSPGEAVTIQPEHLPRETTRYVTAALDESVLLANERTIILEALTKYDWNQTKAAQTLNITRDNIRYRMKKYGLKRPE